MPLSCAHPTNGANVGSILQCVCTNPRSVSRSASSIALCAAMTSCDPRAPRSQASSSDSQSPGANARSRCSAASCRQAVPSKSTTTAPTFTGTMLPRAVLAPWSWQTLTVQQAERLALGLVAAERARRANVTGAEVLEIDGLVLALANLPDPALSSVVVEALPRDAVAALAAAEAEFARRGLQFGIDLQVGRHPEVDAAVRSMGLTCIIQAAGPGDRSRGPARGAGARRRRDPSGRWPG